jgi:ribosomal protein S18 acetylase RimI-like enzyme
VPNNHAQFQVSLLDTNIHDRETFSCGEPSLDDYLKRQASQDIKRRAAVAYVMTSTEDERSIIGYYTLSSASVFLSDLTEESIKKLARYPHAGAFLIGRLAVDERFKGQGLGAKLLRDALLKSLEQSKHIAAAVVAVDALNENARRFYERYGFESLRNQPDTYPQRLYIAMHKLEQALR